MYVGIGLGNVVMERVCEGCGKRRWRVMLRTESSMENGVLAAVAASLYLL